MKKLYIFFTLQFFFAPSIFNIVGTQCSAQCPDGLIVAPCSVSITPATAGESNGSICTCPINGGATPYTYLWSNGQTNSCATGLSAGTYTLLVTDNIGCSIKVGGTGFHVGTVPRFVKINGIEKYLTYILILLIVLLVVLFTRLDRKYYVSPTKSLNISRWVIALALAALFLCLMVSMFLINNRGDGFEI